MKLLTPRLLALAAAALTLNACSSEPSDWRPDEKVSVDMVAPGTRSDEVYASDLADMPSENKGGAIPRPINSSEKLDERAMPNPAEATSADATDLKREEAANDALTSQDRVSSTQDNTSANDPKRQR